jgi:hypothetical protein
MFVDADMEYLTSNETLSWQKLPKIGPINVASKFQIHIIGNKLYKLLEGLKGGLVKILSMTPRKILIQTWRLIFDMKMN